MDPKELLRRYLEQRRELGETELVLDGLTVDEVMRIIGAAHAGPPADRAIARPVERGASAGRPADRVSARTTAESKIEPPGDLAAAPGGAASEAPIDPADWRSILASTGAAPGGGTADRRPRPVPAPLDEPADAPEALASGTPPPEPRAQPEREPVPPPARSVRPPPSREAESPTPTVVPGVGRRLSDLAPSGLVMGTGEAELFSTSTGQATSLQELDAMVKACTRCPLYATATHAVPGEGSAQARLVCVGEAPGASEDATGRPFVGQAGQLLTKILGAINLSRDEVFICNVLKHRPPGNRNPLPDEVKACSPYLVRQLELIRPKVIVCFGTFAAQTLLETKLPIGKLRGLIHRYRGIPLLVTYHPAALLRNPAWKRPTWEDVQLARRILDSAVA